MPMPESDNIKPPVRRKRPVISCRECHRRKQKCDRRQPCLRCIRRGKRDSCVYGLEEDDVSSALFPAELEDQLPNDILQTCSDTTPVFDTTPVASTATQDQIKLLGYANQSKGTPGVINGLGESANPLPNFNGNVAAQNQYASIIRELPSQRHINLLVQDFFKNVAWHYDIVDEATFTGQLDQWCRLTHHQLKQAPDGLPVIIRSFPALLFQVLAQALLFQPEKYNESLDDLKYAPDMALSDRAMDYSDAGHRYTSLFKKNELTLTLVQAELMRVSFQKTTGAVIEAWHTLGVAIRDAQELGLHLMKDEPESEATLSLRTERPSEVNLGRKMWFNLHIWDAHMAVVLGRPMATRMSPGNVAFPTSWSGSSDPPRQPQPRDVILCGYHTAYKFLQDIHDLQELENCHHLVENIHGTLLTNIANLPAWARPQRSRQGEPPWLSASLEVMFTEVHFVLFALHRPFIFSDTSSRGRAYRAAIQILESQARLFDQMEPLQYKAFSLVFATFDAMVLIAAVQIRFPNEFMDQIPATKKSLEWGLNRLSVLQTRNNLARLAFNVVQRLYLRMLVAVSPTSSMYPLDGSTESGSFAGIEAEISPLVNWDIPQPDLWDVLPAQPLNELLSNGLHSIHGAQQTDSSIELYQSLFGSHDNC